MDRLLWFLGGEAVAVVDASDDWLEKAEAGLPMGQLVKPHQIAPLIAYLLSPDSGIITGAIIDYDQQIIGAVPE